MLGAQNPLNHVLLNVCDAKTRRFQRESPMRTYVSKRSILLTFILALSLRPALVRLLLTQTLIPTLRLSNSAPANTNSKSPG